MNLCLDSEAKLDYIWKSIGNNRHRILFVNKVHFLFEVCDEFRSLLQIQTGGKYYIPLDHSYSCKRQQNVLTKLQIHVERMIAHLSLNCRFSTHGLGFSIVLWAFYFNTEKSKLGANVVISRREHRSPTFCKFIFQFCISYVFTCLTHLSQ